MSDRAAAGDGGIGAQLQFVLERCARGVALGASGTERVAFSVARGASQVERAASALSRGASHVERRARSVSQAQTAR